MTEMGRKLGVRRRKVSFATARRRTSVIAAEEHGGALTVESLIEGFRRWFPQRGFLSRPDSQLAGGDFDEIFDFEGERRGACASEGLASRRRQRCCSRDRNFVDLRRRKRRASRRYGGRISFAPVAESRRLANIGAAQRDSYLAILATARRESEAMERALFRVEREDAAAR